MAYFIWSLRLQAQFQPICPTPLYHDMGREGGAEVNVN